MDVESYSHERDDAKLVSAILVRGSEEAQRALYTRYVGRVYRQCRGYAGMTHEDAEDVVQEVFTKAFLKLSALEDPGRFGGWISVIARNQCLELLKKKLRWRQAQSQFKAELDLHISTPSEYVMHEHELEIIHDLIGSVEDESLRETVRSFYVQGLSCEQIAQAQGISVTSVTTRLARFRARVQRELMKKILELHSSDE